MSFDQPSSSCLSEDSDGDLRYIRRDESIAAVLSGTVAAPGCAQRMTSIAFRYEAEVVVSRPADDVVGECRVSKHLLDRPKRRVRPPVGGGDEQCV